MTQDEIIRSPLGREQLVALALEAGFSSREDSSHMYAQSEFDKEICFEEYAIGERVARFAALVAAHEREACAKVCYKYAEESSNPMNFAENCAAAIRARTT